MKTQQRTWRPGYPGDSRQTKANRRGSKEVLSIGVDEMPAESPKLGVAGFEVQFSGALI